ncbi:MAG: Hsp20/alpha crystallin family protein [Candidatus Eisenbacteria sp.]|nr:Hsp20/alpha crystallin family protein [Candidatus Eisenbacteria bacterium]
MNLVKWHPGRIARRSPQDSGSLFYNLDNWMDEFFNWAPLSRTALQSDWLPHVDIREEDEGYVIEMDLPGLDKEDIEVTVDNKLLTISGERKLDETKKDEKVYRRERFCGKFTRSMTFPNDVDAEKIQGSFERGVLHLAIPKPEQTKARRISIK